MQELSNEVRKDMSISNCDQFGSFSPFYNKLNSIEFVHEDIMDSELKEASFIVINYVIQFLNLEQRTSLLNS